MISERIRQARLIAGWSQDELVAKLSAAGYDITKAAISKYENNKSTPNAQLMLKLAKVLQVKPDYFFSEPNVDVQWLAFRRHSDLPALTQQRIMGYAAKVTEQQVELQTLLYPDESPAFPKLRKVSTVEEAEAVAENLRSVWELDEHPVENMSQLVEDHSGVVIEWLEDAGHFDGLAGWGNGVTPIIVINMVVKEDRRRFNLAHEMGHLLMDTSGLKSQDQEKLAHRFAAAFLVPARVARRELGDHRHNLDWQELGLLKQKYGMSMAAWIYRAKALGIINESYCNELWREFSARGWRTVEPYDYIGNEQPSRLRQMTLRAVAEGIISEEHGREICPKCFDPGAMIGDSSYRTVRNLLELPDEERSVLLAQIFEQSANEDFEIFETDSEEDFDDNYTEAEYFTK